MAPPGNARPERSSPPAVIIAHSEPGEARLLALQLALKGLRAEAHPALEGLAELVSAAQADALILDTELFDDMSSGAEALAGLELSEHRNVPIVLVSQGDETAARLQAMRAGAEGYFTKPVDVGELALRLHELVEVTDESAYRAVVIHDGTAHVERMRDALVEAGILAEVLGDPQRAVSGILEFSPDLVLIDAGMRGVDGRKLAARIRQEESLSDLPIVFFTARAGLASAANETIPTEQLLAVVRNHARRSREQQDHADRARKRGRTPRLCNQDYFQAAVERALRTAADGEATFGVLHVGLDIDGLLEGSTQAQREDFLKASEMHLLLQLRSDDIVTRRTDSTFLVLLKHISAENAVMVARRVREAMVERVFECGTRSFTLRCTIGVSLVDQATESAEAALTRAEHAYALALKAGGDDVFLHDDMASALVREKRDARIRQCLRRAVGGAGFHVLSQPILDLKEERVHAYELTLFLHDEEEGTLREFQFRRSAERAGLTGEIDRWLIQHAAELYRTRPPHQAAAPVLINLSNQALTDRTFRSELDELLQPLLAPEPMLIVGLNNDDAATHLKDARDMLTRIVELGGRTALTHFGRSANPFVILKHLPVSFVILDGSVTQNIAHHPQAESSLRTLVDTLHAHRIAIAAAFVDDARMMSVLWRCGVDFVQGAFGHEPLHVHM